MKIIYAEKEVNLNCFAYLECGSKFFHDNEYYIKTKEIERKNGTICNAVNLNTGEHTWFLGSDQVRWEVSTNENKKT